MHVEVDRSVIQIILEPVAGSWPGCARMEPSGRREGVSTSAPGGGKGHEPRASKSLTTSSGGGTWCRSPCWLTRYQRLSGAIWPTGCRHP
jgi:hypothetical protein